MIKSRLIILCLSACYSINSYATLSSFYQYLDTHLVSSVSFGPVWGNGGEAQTFFLGPDIEKTYTVNRSSNTIIDGELFAGIQQVLPMHFQGQFGLAIAATGHTTLSGDVWDDASPIFNNYHYQYQLSHSHVALKGKFILDNNYPVMPWVSVSLGVGFNNAYSFTNTPTIFEAVTMPNFASNTTTAFTYTLGAGIQRQLNKHWQVGAGYEFADWGRSKLSPASGQANGNALSLSHYYTSGILVNATFMA